MSTAGCHTVNIEGMRVPVDHVMIELRLPVFFLRAGELVGWDPTPAAVMDAREIGDPGFRITQADMYGLPRAENPEDWENTEVSLKGHLDPDVRLTDFEKGVLLRGTPLGHGRYTFLLRTDSSGRTDRPEVTLADLKKLGRFSPRAHVYAEPVSGDRVFRTYLPDGEQLDYRSVLGAPVAFNAKKARGAAGRSGKRPGPVWDNARDNPEALMMLVDGISPGSSEKVARISGTRRANAAQMAWILQSPGAVQCVSEVLLDAQEALEYWATEADVARWGAEIADGADPRHFENGFERLDAQDATLDRALRLMRGFADLAEEEPDVLTDFLAGTTLNLRDSSHGLRDVSQGRPGIGKTASIMAMLAQRGMTAHYYSAAWLSREDVSVPVPAVVNQVNVAYTLPALAAALGYITPQQSETLHAVAERTRA